MLFLCSFLQVFVLNSYETSAITTADTSLGRLILVNKTYKLPSGYRPYDLVPIEEKYNKGVMNLLRQEAAAAFSRMCSRAAKDSIVLWSRSAYRSDTVQKQLYENAVERRGKEQAERHTAKPGYSEHQTGLTIDINSTHSSFGKTREADWLRQHAHLFGFIERYPQHKENITGYSYEPWHYRYVGTEVATYIVENNLTLEEYHERNGKHSGDPAR
ncbi:MAG: M15 family metallopeptidase [Bacteroidales bacterium]|nr:M15 family metallopeptidase [Bacteroidales bacterium]